MIQFVPEFKFGKAYQKLVNPIYHVVQFDPQKFSPEQLYEIGVRTIPDYLAPMLMREPSEEFSSADTYWWDDWRGESWRLNGGEWLVRDAMSGCKFPPIDDARFRNEFKEMVHEQKNSRE